MNIYMLPKVIIVIPIYKEISSAIEIISLNQAFLVFKGYPIVFLAPQCMHNYLECHGHRGEYFSDEYFISTESYSQLLLSDKFYKRFIDYEYMLIYQLDAFVFSDRLKFFCSLGYDYIGAPWLRCSRPRFDTSVGNGGFSLRKVKSCLRMVHRKNLVAKLTNLQDRYLRYEDNFFALCGKISQLDFKIPSASEALSFAVEQDVSHYYSRIGEWLPFGCHGWDRDSFDVWRPVFAKFISPEQMEKVECEVKENAERNRKKHRMGFAQIRHAFLLKYLIERILRSPGEAACKALAKCIPYGCEYILWGNGCWGHDAVKFFDALKVPLNCIWDENANIDSDLAKLQIVRPNLAAFDGSSQKIIITTINYAEEISAKLAVKGLKKDNHYFLYEEIRERFVKCYYASLYRKLFRKN